jgi:hypothetical protein
MDEEKPREEPVGPELKVYVPPYGQCEICWSSVDNGHLDNLYVYRGPCVIEVFTD